MSGMFYRDEQSGYQSINAFGFLALAMGLVVLGCVVRGR